MKLRRTLNSKKLFVFFAFLLGTFLMISRTASAESIDMKDWYILDHDSHWHYTGSGQIGSSVDDDFTNTVLDDLLAIGVINATRILTVTDESTDDMNGNEAFWYVDPADSEGKLYFYGFKNAAADSYFAAQTVIPTDPLLLGRMSNLFQVPLLIARL